MAEVEVVDKRPVIEVKDNRVTVEVTARGPQGPAGVAQIDPAQVAVLATKAELAAIELTPGPQGPAGPASTVPGPQGPQGPIGPQGNPGPKGDQGERGLTGLKGDTGSQGPQGIQGLTGNTGPKGDTGSQGIQGLKGDKGDKGDTGATGPAGTNGIDGATGPQGPKGDTGDTGPMGPEGPQGPQGEPGPAGSGTGGGGGEVFGPWTDLMPADDSEYYFTNPTDTLYWKKAQWRVSDANRVEMRGAILARNGGGGSLYMETVPPRHPAKSTRVNVVVVTQAGSRVPCVMEIRGPNEGRRIAFYPSGTPQVNQGDHVSFEGTWYHSSDTTGTSGGSGGGGGTGTNGASAYEVAVANGFVGDETAWLASLVGPAGAPGTPGAKGDTGDTGPQGIPGVKGDTGEQGPKGDKGDTGDTGPAGTVPTNVLTTDTAQTITAGAKTFAAGQLLMQNGGVTAEPYSDANPPVTLQMTESAAATIPTPPNGQATLYTPDGSAVWMKNDAGQLVKVGSNVPTGGTTGQVLSKVNNTDYNVQWTTPSGGTATVPPIGDFNIATNNRYIYPFIAYSATTTATATNVAQFALVCVPIVIPHFMRVSAICFSVNTVPSSGAASVHLFNNSARGLPGTQLRTDGGASVTTTGITTRTITQVALNAGEVYWIGIHTNASISLQNMNPALLRPLFTSTSFLAAPSVAISSSMGSYTVINDATARTWTGQATCPVMALRMDAT